MNDVYYIIMNEPTRDVRKIPIHLEFGSHNERSKDSLSELGGKIDSILKTSNKGKVIVFIESADLSMPDSAFTTLGVNQGLIPSDAFALSSFIAHHGKIATYDELHRWKLKNPIEDPFFKKELEILDDLTRRHPGRIYVLPEWNPEEELEKYDKDESEKNDKKLLQLAYDGKFDEAMPLLKDSLNKKTEWVKSREPRIIQSIKEDLEGEEGILAVVGHIGASHTGVFYELQKEGFSVKRRFPQKYGKKYYYEPYAAALRQMLFFPEKKFSDDDWHKLLILVTTYSAIDVMIDDPRINQEAIKMLWDTVGRFTPEEIKRFEEKAKQNGFIETLESLDRD